MKKTIMFLLVIFFLVGCGEKKSETKYQGVTANVNYTEKAMDALSKKDIPDAIKYFDDAIKADPTNPQKFITLGQVYLGLRNYDRAVDTFSAATKIGPNNAEAYYFLAMSRRLRDRDADKEPAIEAIKKSVELYYAEKNQEGMIKAMALYKNLTGEEEQAEDADNSQKAEDMNTSKKAEDTTAAQNVEGAAAMQ